MKICVRTVAHSLHCPYRSRLTFHWSAPCEGFPRRMFVRNASCDVIRLPIDLIASTAACSSKSVFAYGLGCACFSLGSAELSQTDGCCRCCRVNRWCCCARAAELSLSLSLLFACSLSFPFTHTLSPSSPSSLLSSTRTKRSVMASSNHVTPTNCSWWPISAMDEDGKITDGEECEEPAAEPKPFNKDRLVLYHWTQSFTSQKVKKKKSRAWKWRWLHVSLHDTMLQLGAASVCLLWPKRVCISACLSCTYTSGIWISSCSWAELPFETSTLQHGGLISSTESSVFDQCSIISHRIDHLSHLICFHPRLTRWGYYLPIMLVNVVRLLWALTHDILNNWSKCCAKQTPKAISHLLQLNHTICSYFHAFLQSTCDLLTCMLPRNEHVFIKILHCHTNNSENINDYHREFSTMKLQQLNMKPVCI